MIALFLYLFLSLFLGKKNPMFYLILPFALQQGQAAFIDQSITIAGKKIFSVYDSVFKDVLFFIVVIISIFLIKARLPRLKYTGSVLIFTFLVYIFLLFVVNIFSPSDADEVFLTTRQLFYISLSYFLWLSVFHVVTRSQFEAFLKLMFYVTPVSALLYVLNSSGIVTIFDKTLIYQEIEYGVSNFLRDFKTIPIYLIPITILTIQSLLVPTIKIPKPIFFINIVLLPLALLFTFTRSLFISVLIQAIIMVGLYFFAYRLKSIKRVLVFFFLLIFALTPAYLLINKFLPDQLDYLANRFNAVATEGVKEHNVDIRVAYLHKAIEITDNASSMFGAGLNRQYYSQMNAVGAWVADSTIPYFLYHTGWLGVFFLFII